MYPPRQSPSCTTPERTSELCRHPSSRATPRSAPAANLSFARFATLPAVLTAVLTSVLVCGCAENLPPEPARDDCWRGDPSLVLGSGIAMSFAPYEDGDVVRINTASQGGFGIPIRGQTTGLRSGQQEDRVDVLLDAYIGEEKVGSFLNQNTPLYCGEDGLGLFWGVTVGFDPDRYGTNDELLELNDETVTLVVTATDADGVSVTGEVDVVVKF